MNPNNPMEQFFTRGRANAGVKVPLYLPSGEESEHFLMVHGVDSDEFRAADMMSRRENLKIAEIKDLAKRDIAIADLTRTLRAKLVISWSFDMPCTFENVYNFLKEAPQIADGIDRVASNRKAFFAEGLLSSSPTPGMSSGSTQPSPEATSQGEPTSSRSQSVEEAPQS